MSVFRITLALHAPVILPIVPPRLDKLLLEGKRRLTQDWETDHALPLVFDEELQGYRNSQLIFATTPKHGLFAQTIALASKPLQGDLHMTKDIVKRPINKPQKIKLDGGPNAPRMTKHSAIAAPYAVFYAEGDISETLACLGTIRAVGREHSRHFGAFSILGAERVKSAKWALRSWPASAEQRAKELLDIAWVPDQQALRVGQPDVDVVRPARVQKEVFDG